MGNIETNKISLVTSDRVSLYSIVETALKYNAISSSKARELYQEADELCRDLVAYYNHQNSTSLSRNSFTRIWDTINYMFIHGFNVFNQSYSSLNEHHIREFYTVGLNTVLKDVETIHQILKQVRNRKLSISNDRYLSILNEQIPNYLLLLMRYNAIFNYCAIDEDLDYPLFDGLPLYHDMYHLSGTDLVLTYLKRFQIENDFCFYFKDQIPDLIRQYESCKGVSIEYLGVNIFEIILVQCIAHLCLFDCVGIFLEKTDVDRLQRKLMHTNILEEIEIALSKLHELITQEIADTICYFKKEIVSKFESFIQDDIDIFIYPRDNNDKKVIILNQSSTNINFLRVLEHVSNLDNLHDKVNYLKTIEMSIYDVFDLLENDIFVKEEYFYYFSSCSTQEVAIFIKALLPDIGSFHQKCILDDNLYNELDCSIEWQQYFKEFLMSCDNITKKEIEENINKIILNSN